MGSHIIARSLKYIQSPSNANSYKCKCIDFYLRKFKCQLIASEFRYGKLQLITDLLILTTKNVVSIEIKAEHDDLRRLCNQVIEAQKNFNLIIVFSAAKHLNSLLSILPPEIGITVYEKNKITVIRNPQRLPLQMDAVIWSIPIIFLRKYFIVPCEYNSDETREYILRHFQGKIVFVYREFLRSRFQSKYIQFMSDRGVETHVEDIPILSMKEYIEKL